MWERQYEHGRWNGHKLNILSTAIDGGKRLHVSEIPYADLPHIKVMGSKARSISVDLVFVGPTSLVDANAFIDNLEETPEGELEHPWLGELKLVFETFGQNINTKRGLVTFSVTFVRSGTSPSITTTAAVRTKEQASIVDGISADSFAADLEAMSVSEINLTQSLFTKVLNVLVDIVNRLSLADDVLQSINHAIHEAFSAISSISNQPKEFSSLFSSAVDAVAEGVRSEPESKSEAVDNSRNAQRLLLEQVKETPTTHHYNVLIVTGALKMSKDIAELEKEDHFDVTKPKKQPDIIQNDIETLIESIDDRIDEATQVSTVESMALFDALVNLKDNVQLQRDKVVEGRAPHRLVPSPKFQPALVLAHDEYTKENVLTAINALQHPLFMRGDIAVRDA